MLSNLPEQCWSVYDEMNGCVEMCSDQLQVVAALARKRRLFLGDEQWRMVPWLRNPALKTQQSELLDILVVVPGILQDYTEMVQSISTKAVQVQGLLNRIRTKLSLLYSWRWKWQARFAHEIRADTDCELPGFNVAGELGRLHFDRLAVAAELMLYNTTLMWLMALLFKLRSSDATGDIEDCATAARPSNDVMSTVTSFHPLLGPGEAVTLREPALEICRAFEWVIRHHNDRTEPT